MQAHSHTAEHTGVGALCLHAWQRDGWCWVPCFWHRVGKSKPHTSIATTPRKQGPFPSPGQQVGKNFLLLLLLEGRECVGRRSSWGGSFKNQVTGIASSVLLSTMSGLGPSTAPLEPGEPHNTWVFPPWAPFPLPQIPWALLSFTPLATIPSGLSWLPCKSCPLFPPAHQ